MLELFEFGLSGNCHKVRMMLSLLGLEYKSRILNGAEREQKSFKYLAMNPLGQVPVLKDGEKTIRDSQAILVYLARAYGSENWFPNDATKAAAITQWLSIAANEIAHGPAALRAHHLMGRAINVEAAEQITKNLLSVLDTRLRDSSWLAADTITIADIAVYPYIALAHQGSVDLTPFIFVKEWLVRIETLNGFISMPGIQLNNI
jgi:glutathione S-transferase